MVEERNQPQGMQEFFDQRSKSYDKHMQDNVASFEDFYRAVAYPLPRTDLPLRILDLGCGTGLEMEWILKNVPQARITGIDLSPHMLAECRAKYAARKEQITLIEGSYLDHPLGEEAFDYAVSVMTFHHLLPEKKYRLYCKIFHSLKPGGVYIEGDYIVSEQKSQRLLEEYRRSLSAGKDMPNGAFHIDIPFSMAQERDLLQRAGFSSVREIWNGEEAVVFQAAKG